VADPAPRPWRILVVDDEPAVQLVLERLFARMGHPVLSAKSMPEALTLLARPWDLFLIDKNLPQGSGVELAKVVRERFPAAVIVLITAFATRESLEALAGIVDDYVTKPFELEHLREELTALMEAKKRGRLVQGQVALKVAPTATAARPRTGPAPGVHIAVTDARDEALLLGAARQAGLSATSGPLGEKADPDLLVVDGRSATLPLRKLVWLRQARAPALRVAVVVDEASLEDATVAVALKAVVRAKRPLTPEGALAAMTKLKG
jgi:CheY-like chemotaxis protein